MSRRPARGLWPLRDLPVVLWLMALVVVVLAHPFVDVPHWLLIHLVLLGAVSHAILVWSKHFADALLHTAPLAGDRRDQSARLLLLNIGVLLVVVGVLSDVWTVTATGAAAVAGAVVWHGAGLLLQLRQALPARFAVTVRYYVAACCFLPVGAVLGATLARGLPDRWHEQVAFTHAAINLLGWMGLTIVGTLVTLWPTMLRTRLADGSERAARRAFPVLVTAIAVTAGGALSGQQLVAALGIIGYLTGLAMVARPVISTARRKSPSSYPTWSILAGLIWLAGTLVVLAIGVATAASWDMAGDRLGSLTMFLVPGFAAQVLLGALSYLVPVVLGGGPTRVRAAVRVLDRGGALRIVIVNASLLACALPFPGRVRVICAAFVVGGLAAFLPLLFLSICASRAQTTSVAAASAGGRAPT